MLRADVWSWLPSGDVVRVSPGGEGAWYQACVHPDGDHVVFWGGVDGEPPRLWRSSTDGRGPAEPLTGTESAARHPSYGAAGDRIAFVSDRDGGRSPTTMAEENPSGGPPAGNQWHVFTMAPDGTDVRQVTGGDHREQRPAMSPDGLTIAFVSDRGFGVWLVPSDGSAEPRQVAGDDFLYRPWWSVDGSSLFAFRYTQERRQSGRIDLARERWAPLDNDDTGNTHGPYADLRGDRLLVHCDREGRWALWEVPLDGSPMVKLRPPGHEERVVAHGTRARNGIVTFDEAGMP